MAAEMPIPVTPKKSIKPVIWVVIVIFIAMIIGLSLYVYLKSNANDNANANFNTVTNLNTTIDRTEWQTYSNKELGFSLTYPEDWSVQTIETDVLDRELNDTVLTKGSCPSQGCKVSTDICEVVVSREPDPTDTKISAPQDWIRALPSYKGDDIAKSLINNFDTLRTTVAVTPISDGIQGMGVYFLIATPTEGAYLSATLAKGFANTSCESDMDAILQSLTQ